MGWTQAENNRRSNASCDNCLAGYPKEVAETFLGANLLACEMGAIPTLQACCKTDVKGPGTQAVGSMNLLNQQSCFSH